MRYATVLMMFFGVLNMAVLYGLSTSHFKYPSDRQFVYHLMLATVAWIAFGLWISYRQAGTVIRQMWFAAGAILALLTVFAMGATQGG